MGKTAQNTKIRLFLNDLEDFRPTPAVSLYHTAYPYFQIRRHQPHLIHILMKAGFNAFYVITIHYPTLPASRIIRRIISSKGTDVVVIVQPKPLPTQYFLTDSMNSAKTRL